MIPLSRCCVTEESRLHLERPEVLRFIRQPFAGRFVNPQYDRDIEIWNDLAANVEGIYAQGWLFMGILLLLRENGLRQAGHGKDSVSRINLLFTHEALKVQEKVIALRRDLYFPPCRSSVDLLRQCADDR